MFRALRKLFGGNDTGVEFPPSKVFAMELLTKSLAISTTNDKNVVGHHAGFYIENRDLAEYIALMRRNSRSWAEQQDKVLFWNKESFDDAGMTEHRGYNTGSVVQGIYVGRAKRLLNNIAKVNTQAQLLAIWKDKDRVNDIMVYMASVEWEIRNTLDRLQLEINQ
jgi:hypothetical protein